MQPYKIMYRKKIKKVNYLPKQLLLILKKGFMENQNIINSPIKHYHLVVFALFTLFIKLLFLDP